MRLLSIPAVVVVVLGGIWVTGGLITNDFGVSMWLTAGWMAVAGAACVAIAVRSRALRWPVLGAYATVAAVAGVYLASSVFFDRVVDETVAMAAPAPAAMASMGDGGGGAAREERPARPMNVLLREGRFSSVRHPGEGTARFIRLARGGRVLTLTGFDVDNGPDLRLYLVAGPARSEGEVRDYVDLGGLKGNRGDQQYDVPARVDVSRYSTVVVWCRAFSVLFVRAPTRA